MVSFLTSVASFKEHYSVISHERRIMTSNQCCSAVCPSHSSTPHSIVIGFVRHGESLSEGEKTGVQLQLRLSRTNCESSSWLYNWNVNSFRKWKYSMASSENKATHKEGKLPVNSISQGRLSSNFIAVWLFSAAQNAAISYIWLTGNNCTLLAAQLTSDW